MTPILADFTLRELFTGIAIFIVLYILIPGAIMMFIISMIKRKNISKKREKETVEKNDDDTNIA